ncbi:hypothetical protein niasHT_003946 [Heterodera trifolii]|uniref:DUF7515 domain-containing protein n=1 Tax=Heterodera trifolii TaxID=157864 RepID=A0ABD2LV91_9BILA
MSDDLRKELEGLNLCAGAGRGRRQRGTVVTESMIDDFCKIVYKVLLVTAEGYLYTSDIANNIYDDNGIDPYRRALDLGFNSFNAFLHSEHMKKYIEIDSSGGVLSYHAILTPELILTIGHIQRERQTFLSMKRTYPSRRTNGFNQSEEMGPLQFLKERMQKRELQAQMGGPTQEEETQSETVQEPSCVMNDGQYGIEEEFFEEIGENEQLGLDRIKWVQNDSDEEGEETLIFCETETSG